MWWQYNARVTIDNEKYETPRIVNYKQLLVVSEQTVLYVLSYLDNCGNF